MQEWKVCNWLNWNTIVNATVFSLVVVFIISLFVFIIV